MHIMSWQSAADIVDLCINRRLEDCVINIVKNAKHQFLMSPVFSLKLLQCCCYYTSENCVGSWEEMRRILSPSLFLLLCCLSFWITCKIYRMCLNRVLDLPTAQEATHTCPSARSWGLACLVLFPALEHYISLANTEMFKRHTEFRSIKTWYSLPQQT